MLWGITTSFPMLSPCQRYVVYALRTRPPVTLLPPWLACIRPAASVHPEPGSNSPSYILYGIRKRQNVFTTSSITLAFLLFFPNLHSSPIFHSLSLTNCQWTFCLQTYPNTFAPVSILQLSRNDRSRTDIGPLPNLPPTGRYLTSIPYPFSLLIFGLQRYNNRFHSTKFFARFFYIFFQARPS